MIQVYTGDGKGKTTAAIGLAVRAAGAGKRVCILQFLKKGKFCEHYSLNKMKNVTCKQFGSGNFIKKTPNSKDILLAERGMKFAFESIKKQKYDVLILDEINVAIYLNLLKIDQIIKFLKTIPKDVEVILTGRNAHPCIMQMADLVSEVKNLKHYYQGGLRARKGIEF